jgi:hypothetical protein
MRLLLREFIITKDSLGEEHNLEELKAQAERNFDQGLQTFELMTVPSFENILAITAAVSFSHFASGARFLIIIFLHRRFSRFRTKPLLS